MRRPLGRYAARLALLFGDRRWRHRQDWWPGLSIRPATADALGTAIYKGEKACDLLPLQDIKHPGDQVIVIGSGPSTRTQVFSGIPPRASLLLNGAIHLLDGRLAAPLAVIIEDERFVWRHFAEMRSFIGPDIPCLFSTSVLRAICEIRPEWLRERPIHHVDFLHKPYGALRPAQSDLERLDFLRWNASRTAALSLEPWKGFFAGGSVAVTALQLAIALRPAAIGFAGIDLSNADQPRFYETAGQTAKSRILQAQHRILAAFAIALSVCRECGIDLVNYSPASALTNLGIPYDDELTTSSAHQNK